jgi:hypothetical protein
VQSTLLRNFRVTSADTSDASPVNIGINITNGDLHDRREAYLYYTFLLFKIPKVKVRLQPEENTLLYSLQLLVLLAVDPFYPYPHGQVWIDQPLWF